MDQPGEVASQVTILYSRLSSSRSDRLAAKHAAYVLWGLAYDEVIRNSTLDCGIIPALLKHLKAPEPVGEGDVVPRPYEHEVEDGCVAVLGLLACKPEHRQRIVDAGALPCLVDLLKRHKTYNNSPALSGLLKRAADAITNLTVDYNSIKTRVGMEGGIPPLVELLEYDDAKVQSAAAGALRSLAFKNYDNKKQIVGCNALPALVLMLGSKDAATHRGAVNLIATLVRSSPDIQREVLRAGALQPVIGLLRSCNSESQRDAALLISLLAETDSDCKVHIAQRGAIQPLIDMLKSPNAQLQEMSASALARLAQDTHNQAGIAYNGGIEPLVNLLCSKNGHLRQYVAFALYSLANNEDSVVDIIKAGGVQKLQDGDFKDKVAKALVGKTMKRLEKKMHGRVLKQLLHLMCFGEKAVQRHVALALAHLCGPDDRKLIFVDNNGLKFLLDLLKSTNIKQKHEALMALHSLVVRATSVSPSDAFPAMPDGGYREREAKDIQIPNIKWDVFELMMRFIYIGTRGVNLDIAQDLLRAADQYLLDDVQRPCERAKAKDISVENVSLMGELSKPFNARQACLLFLLEQFDKSRAKPWYSCLMRSLIPSMRKFFSRKKGENVQKCKHFDRKY